MCLGKFNKIAKLANSCRPSVKALNTAIVFAISLSDLTSKEIKDYIRWIGNRRLVQLGLESIYKIDKNPLTWLDTMLNAVEHMNFFEGRATEYSKASTKGTLTEAFS